LKVLILTVTITLVSYTLGRIEFHNGYKLC